jgi:hypothetical protein
MYAIKINKMKKEGGNYNIMFSHAEIEYDYEVTLQETAKCSSVITDEHSF